MSLPSQFISVEDLQKALAGEQKPILLDVRFDRERSDFRADYEAGHIEGAIYVNLSQAFAGEGGGVKGSRPLPEAAVLQQHLNAWGVSETRDIVVYGLKTDTGAARAWFVLQWAGLRNVRVLDGGLNAWQAAGLPLSTQEPQPVAAEVPFQINETGHLPVFDADQIAAHLAKGGKAFDARGKDGYVKGHLPAAVHLASGGFIGADGKLLPREALAERIAKAGITEGEEIAVYCGGGMAASLASLVLISQGITPHHFVGSYSAWSADPSRPVTEGEAP